MPQKIGSSPRFARVFFPPLGFHGVKRKLSPFCVSPPSLVTKHPTRATQGTEEGFALTHSLRVQSTLGRKSGQWECEAAGHIVSKEEGE